jgi:hypothetical protein
MEAVDIKQDRERFKYRRRFLVATLAGSGFLFGVALVMNRSEAYAPLAALATLAVMTYTGAATYQQAHSTQHNARNTSTPNA